MAITMDQVKTFAATYLDKKEDEIDAAILEALAKNPIGSSLTVNMTIELWSAFKLLWPRYVKAGWSDAKFNDGLATIIHKLDLSTLKRDNTSPKVDAQDQQDRAIKLD